MSNMIVPILVGRGSPYKHIPKVIALTANGTLVLDSPPGANQFLLDSNYIQVSADAARTLKMPIADSKIGGMPVWFRVTGSFAITFQDSTGSTDLAVVNPGGMIAMTWPYSSGLPAVTASSGTGGTMSWPNGTAALPGLPKASDPDTGFYGPGANQIGVALGGVAGLIVSPTTPTFGAGTDTAGQDVFVYAANGGASATAARNGAGYQDSAGSGSVGTAAINGGNGGDRYVQAGDGGAKTGTGSASGGLGGVVYRVGGAGGATASTGTGNGGSGGAIQDTGGVGGAATGAGSTGNGGEGGRLIRVAGAGGTTVGGTAGAGGAVQDAAGAGAAQGNAVVGGTGGAIQRAGGAGGANTGGASGQSGGNGGSVSDVSGAGGATNSTNGAHSGGSAGSMTRTGGVGGACTAGTGNGGAGGTITDTGGRGGNSLGGTGGAGGDVSHVAGNGGNGVTSGPAGDYKATAGSAGTGGNVNGGSIRLTPGAGVGTGQRGSVVIEGAAPVPLLTNSAAAGLADADATLTDAQHRGGNLTITSTNRTLTTRTAAQLVAAFPRCQVGSTYELNIVNLSAAGFCAIAMGAGCTAVGGLVVLGTTASTTGGAGSWYMRFTNVGAGTEAVTFQRRS